MLPSMYVPTKLEQGIISINTIPKIMISWSLLINLLLLLPGFTVPSTEGLLCSMWYIASVSYHKSALPSDSSIV